jgi:hypothetical protein
VRLEGQSANGRRQVAGCPEADGYGGVPTALDLEEGLGYLTELR